MRMTMAVKTMTMMVMTIIPTMTMEAMVLKAYLILTMMILTLVVTFCDEQRIYSSPLSIKQFTFCLMNNGVLDKYLHSHIG